MSKLLRSLTDRLTNGSSPDPHATKPRDDGFVTAKGLDALFTRTTAEADGDACLHDCDSCTVSYPRKFAIDEDDKLYGEIKGWSRHLLVATGKADWVRDVEDEAGSVMQAVGKHRDAVAHGRLMLSASNMPVPDSAAHSGPYGADRPTSVLLLPAFALVDHVTPAHVPQLIASVVNAAPTNTTPLDDARSGSLLAAAAPLPAGLALRRCPHDALILLCSQGTRDARCGQSAPLLRRALERQLRPLGLYRDLHDERPGGVGIYFISHVGGHKYSANVLVYRRGAAGGARGRSVREQIDGVAAAAGGKEEEEEEQGGRQQKQGHEQQGEDGDAEEGLRGSGDGGAAQCIWLARVRPEDCENLVRFTVLQGKVVKPERQLRGGFDRAKGVVSW